SLKALGAKIILSDSRKGGNSHGELAMEIQIENPEYVMLNQGQNPANPEIHRLTTAPEILEDFQNETIDYFIASIGTGGHITGIGEILKKEKPKVTIIGVQPDGCELLENKFFPHNIQGLAVGIIPKVLNVNIIDRMISVTFEESLQMMKNLSVKEGLSVGISSGANVAAALKVVEEVQQKKQLHHKVNILTMAYDSAIDYLDLFD
ncbi:MAG: pyridoxal-phosphate dependent enzyme, partial [Oscillatoriales cyanobacterium]